MLGLFFLALHATTGIVLGPQWSQILWSVMICLVSLEILLLRRLGVTLTPREARVHNLRRRVVPWSEVQAVVPDTELWTRRVVLITETGERIGLRAPTSYWGMNRAGYERDYHRIGQWWLAHRGVDWTPAWPSSP